MCNGTGKLLLLNSWFVIDGYRYERCGICGGSGESSYKPENEAVRFQKAARSNVEQWGARKPPERIARKLAPAFYR